MLCIQLLFRTHFDLPNRVCVSQRSRDQGGETPAFHLPAHPMFHSLIPGASHITYPHHPQPKSFLVWSPGKIIPENSSIFHVNRIHTGRKSPSPFICLETWVYLNMNHLLVEFTWECRAKGSAPGVGDEKWKRGLGHKGQGDKRQKGKDEGGGEEGRKMWRGNDEIVSFLY